MKNIIAAVMMFIASSVALAMTTDEADLGSYMMVIRVDLLDDKPRPVVILNHGDVYGPRGEEFRRNVKPTFGMPKQLVNWWKSKGFHVVSPLRMGYGSSGHSYTGDFGGCRNPDMFNAIMNQAADVVAAVNYLKGKQWFNGNVILQGNSGGGAAVVYASVANDRTVRGIVNFSGLRGSKGDGIPCGVEQQKQMIQVAGKATRTPQLWIYAANDPKISVQVVKDWASTFQAEGGNLKLLITRPIYKRNGEDDGHAVMGKRELWDKEVTDFLRRVM